MKSYLVLCKRDSGSWYVSSCQLLSKEEACSKASSLIADATINWHKKIKKS